MRIALDLTAVPTNAGGVGTYVINLASQLAQLGTDDRFVFIGSPEVLEMLHQTRERVEQVPMSFATVAHRLAWEQLRLPALLEQQRIDVLHSPHYTMPLRGRTTSVVTWHDMTFFLHPELHTRAKQLFFQRMMRLSGRRADMIIAVSESTRQDILRIRRLNPEKVATVPLAASEAFRPRSPSEIFQVRVRYGIAASPYLLFVGVLEPRKNVPTLISAFQRIAEREPDLTLAIAGKKGWMYSEIFASAEALGLRDRVRFLGYVPYADLPALYGGATAFVYPSLYEGFGLPVLEAMQSGTPVITSRVSSMGEVGAGGAILVDPMDAEQIAREIIRIRHEPGHAALLSELGRQRASSYSWQRCARETHAVYHLAAERRWTAKGAP